jgi:prolyl-tRNA synthetase
MGSYGIGPSRLVAAIIEASHDDAASNGRRRWRRSRWRSSISSRATARTDAACESLYRDLTAKGVDALYDDTDQRAGGKFATADLIGVPWQVMIGPKGLAAGDVRGQEAGRRQPGKLEPGRNDRSVVAMILCVSRRGVPPKLA